MQKTNYLEQKIIEAVLKNTSFAGGANTYVGLFTAAPSDTGGGTEVSGGAYARQAIAAASGWSAGGQVGGAYEVNNGADVAFPVATANWGEILAAGIFDAVTAGNLLYWHWLSQTKFFFTGANTGDLFTAPAHTLANDNRVILQTPPGSALPAGVSADTVYYVIGVSGITFQLSLTQGGAAITLTGDGSGEVHLLQPKTITTDDQFKFLAGNLKVAEA